MPTDYSRIHERLADAKLLEIVERAEDYAPEAVESAKQELARRELTDQDFAELRKRAAEVEARNSKRQEQWQTLQTRAEESLEVVYGLQHPDKKIDRSVDFKIKAISATFLLAILWSLYSLGAAFFSENSLIWSYYRLDLYIDIVNLVVLSVTLWFWHKRKRLGWYLVAGQAGFSLPVIFAMMLLNAQTAYRFKSQYGDQGDDLAAWMYDLGLDEINYVELDHLVCLGVTLGLLWVITRIPIRQAFSLSKFQQDRTLLIGSVLGVVVGCALYAFSKL